MECYYLSVVEENTQYKKDEQKAIGLQCALSKFGEAEVFSKATILLRQSFIETE